MRRKKAAKKREKRVKGTKHILPWLLALAVLAAAAVLAVKYPQVLPDPVRVILGQNPYDLMTDENVTQELLPVNSYSRPGIKIGRISGIVVHYVANPGTSAEQNRDYFAGLAESGATHASAHFIIGLDGEIIQCVPLNEMAYASNSRNDDTISIECCHPGEDGKFTDATYDSLVSLVCRLCRMYHLDENDVIRHYDITGKLCPLYFVEHEDAWEDFLSDVTAKLNETK